jgi:hypothetical protein
VNSLIFKRVELVARRVPRPVRPLLYAAGGVWWLLAPIVVFAVLMALASLATWGVAWLVYDYKGRPQNWEWRSQRSQAAQVANVLQPQRTNRVYFIGVPLELPEERFLQTIARYNWQPAGAGATSHNDRVRRTRSTDGEATAARAGVGALRLNDRVMMVYGMDGDGIVTRVQVTVDGIDEQQLIGLMGRCMGTWGNPVATAGPIGDSGRAFEAATWRDERATVVFDIVPKPGRQQAYRMHLSIYSWRDPLFEARKDTFGQRTGHRLLEELRENAQARAEGKVPAPGPAAIGPGGNPVIVSPQRVR